MLFLCITVYFDHALSRLLYMLYFVYVLFNVFIPSLMTCISQGLSLLVNI